MGNYMKKIYIHTDLEGVSGIDRGEMVPNGSPDYAYCVERLMADVNAAVDGAFLGGASHVTVLDSHGGGGNFDLAKLDPRAEPDARPNKKWWGILDGSYWGTLFIGAHAMAGTLRGFLDHTQSSERIYNYYINGRKTGELGQWAVVAAQFGVPLIMASGDEAGVAEAAGFFGDIETAAVKRGISRQRARLAGTLEAAAEGIREAARRAVAKLERPPAYAPLLPMEIKIEYTRADYCEEALERAQRACAAQAGAKAERIGARELRAVARDYINFPLS